MARNNECPALEAVLGPDKKCLNPSGHCPFTLGLRDRDSTPGQAEPTLLCLSSLWVCAACRPPRSFGLCSRDGGDCCLLHLLIQGSAGLKSPTKDTGCIPPSSVHTDPAPDQNVHSFEGHTSQCVPTHLSEVGPSFGVREPGWAFLVEAAVLYPGWPYSFFPMTAG